MRVFSSCLNVFTRNSSPSLELDTPLTRDKLSAKIVRNSPYCEVKHDNGLKETLVQKLSALNDKQKDSFIEICNTLLIGLREEWHNPNLATEYEGKGSKFFACVRGEYQSNTINITEIGVRNVLQQKCRQLELSNKEVRFIISLCVHKDTFRGITEYPKTLASIIGIPNADNLLMLHKLLQSSKAASLVTSANSVYTIKSIFYPLTGNNLSGLTLSRVGFSGCDLQNADLAGSNLQGSNFEGGNLTCADFTSANLEKANLRNTRLTFARFRGVNLWRVCFAGSNLSSVDLTGAHFTAKQHDKNLNPFNLPYFSGSLITDTLFTILSIDNRYKTLRITMLQHLAEYIKHMVKDHPQFPQSYHAILQNVTTRLRQHKLPCNKEDLNTFFANCLSK